MLLEFFIAPAVAALIVIIAQFFIQPLMQKNITARSELWLHKKEIYIKTIAIIDKRFDSMVFKNSRPVADPPTNKEFNEVYRELLLVCDDDEILIRFQKFMDTSVEGYCSPANRGDFINLIRKDLGKSKFSIKPKEIPYFRKRFRE
ncbi:hypothetical protein MYX07_04310 [Patescibacteria group bacterium AH-259-L07]|nr:hypothetical protein [Patescibacteria group bacterium AH-259-L07]